LPQALTVGRISPSSATPTSGRQVAHLHIRRDEAVAKRRASLKASRPSPGFDRDEYPPAMSDEGGRRGDVRLVRSAENRSAGSVTRRQFASYWNMQGFIIERLPSGWP